jgi:hypothetical protein
MKEFLSWLKVSIPVLFSPQFWGVVATAFFNLGRVKGWIDVDWMTFFTVISGGATTIGAGLKAARSLRGTVNAQIENVEKVTVESPEEVLSA